MKINKYLVVLLSVLSIGLITVCSSHSDSDVISEKDSARLKDYILKTYASELPADAVVEVTGYEKTDIKGFKKGNFKLSFSGRSIDLPFLIDGSGKYIVLGQPISTADFEATQIKGIKKGFIQISNRNFPILITEDSKYIIAGEVIDTTIDVAKETMDKISLTDVPVKGKKDAKVTIVEYSDFQCPFCSRANPIIDQLMKDYKDKIKVVYKQFPLPMHNWAKPASVASLCTHKLGGDEKFWNFHDKVFANQKLITLNNANDKFKEYAKEFGIDNKKFEECIADNAVSIRVDQEMAEGNSIGVNSTPTFVVNGIVVRGANPDGIKSAIDMSMK
jgi:protein-disulfide isomerase